ncbi:hypothetical protein BDF14DRAFT_1778562 [Spinellus fusiger]|nr:hypothetical protein BDF14DRAFT_1778562 [Spinellus fusiger]
MSVYYANEDNPDAQDRYMNGFLLFRKIKLSSYINRLISDKKLVNILKEKFADEAILVYGNWFAGHVKFHEPIRRVGMRRMLRKKGFNVYLINEFKTSSFCPPCQNRALEKYKKVKNPRSYQRSINLDVLCVQTIFF